MPADLKTASFDEQNDYLMAGEDENLRLDIKTDPEAVRRQALWCGVKPGLRVLDAGCGAGITTSILGEMVWPEGRIVGLDYAAERIDYARQRYGMASHIEFHLHDLRNSCRDFGTFDLIWSRFVLEYHRDEATSIVGHLIECLKPGGVLCLLDLDYNCLSHYALSGPMQDILVKIMATVEQKYHFDPYIGRKLYSFLYQSGLKNIEVDLLPHNLFYGKIEEKDIFNITKKIETIINLEPDLVGTYPGGAPRFQDDFRAFLVDPGRFSYTPLLMCKGKKPENPSNGIQSASDGVE